MAAFSQLTDFAPGTAGTAGSGKIVCFFLEVSNTMQQKTHQIIQPKTMEGRLDEVLLS